MDRARSGTLPQAGIVRRSGTIPRMGSIPPMLSWRRDAFGYNEKLAFDAMASAWPKLYHPEKAIFSSSYQVINPQDLVEGGLQFSSSSEAYLLLFGRWRNNDRFVPGVFLTAFGTHARNARQLKALGLAVGHLQDSVSARRAGQHALGSQHLYVIKLLSSAADYLQEVYDEGIVYAISPELYVMLIIVVPTLIYLVYFAITYVGDRN